MINERANPVPVIEKPVIQARLDQIEDATMDLTKVLDEIDGHLNRLTNRPPQPVRGDDGAAESRGDAPRPTVEGALNLHLKRLTLLRSAANEVLARLRAAI